MSLYDDIIKLHATRKTIEILEYQIKEIEKVLSNLRKKVEDEKKHFATLSEKFKNPNP